MNPKSLFVCAVLSIGVASAVPMTVATFSTASNFNWGGCATSCSIPVTFTYDGVSNNAPYDAPLQGTLTYSWTKTGTATVNGNDYSQGVFGDFVFTFTPPGQPEVNLLTVDFAAAKGVLVYVGLLGDLFLGVTPTTSGGTAPIVTSSILNVTTPLADWQFLINLGSLNPGIAGGNITDFSTNGTGSIGVSPRPGGEIPEPASMLMAGAGLLTIGGLIRMKRRLQK